VQDLLESIRALTVSTEISPRDRMYHPGNARHYYYVGRSNLLTLYNVLNLRKSYPGGGAPVRDILDLGCGHGRVHRWLRAGFPEATLHVTDYDKTGVEFCVENFGALDTQGELPAASFDLIWLGSVFTHLPAAVTEALLGRMTAALRPNGVLVFTSQGRFSIARIEGFDWENDTREWMHYALARDKFEEAVRLYHETGYGYVDYPSQVNYGVCIARPEWYAARVLASNDFTQILFQEKGSDNHQDVSAFMRANVVDGGKGPLW
jgi:SAM-dependent methyltransferase